MRHTIVVMVVVGALGFGVVLNVLPRNEITEHAEHHRHIETPKYEPPVLYINAAITSSGSYEPVNPLMSSHST